MTRKGLCPMTLKINNQRSDLTKKQSTHTLVSSDTKFSSVQKRGMRWTLGATARRLHRLDLMTRGERLERRGEEEEEEGQKKKPGFLSVCVCTP